MYEILRLHRDYGQVSNPFACPRARPCILNSEDINYISSILEANPGLYIDEIQQQLLDVRDVEISVWLVSRALRRLALARKRVTKEAMERMNWVRATWQAQYGTSQ